MGNERNVKLIFWKLLFLLDLIHSIIKFDEIYIFNYICVCVWLCVPCLSIFVRYQLSASNISQIFNWFLLQFSLAMLAIYNNIKKPKRMNKIIKIKYNFWLKNTTKTRKRKEGGSSVIKWKWPQRMTRNLIWTMMIPEINGLKWHREWSTDWEKKLIEVRRKEMCYFWKERKILDVTRNIWAR